MTIVRELIPWLDELARGTWITIVATTLGSVGALIISVIFGLMARTRARTPRFFARCFIELFRGTSLLVQLWWFFFVLPTFGWILNPLAVAALAYSLNFGAYGAEVVRGAINAVPRDQWEAAVALNMSAWQRMRLVIFPQAVVRMIPPFTSILIGLLKSTPLVFTITLVDLTAIINFYRDAEGNTAFIFGLSLVIYFVLAYVIRTAMNLLERIAKVRVGEEPGRGRSLLRFRHREGESL